MTMVFKLTKCNEYVNNNYRTYYILLTMGSAKSKEITKHSKAAFT